MSETPVTRAEFETLQNDLAEIKAQLQLLLATQKTAPTETVSIDEDTLAALAATVAAYLGKRATIKFVRRVSTEEDAWSIQGRAAISGSHGMPRKRGW